MQLRWRRSSRTCRALFFVVAFAVSVSLYLLLAAPLLPKRHFIRQVGGGPDKAAARSAAQPQSPAAFQFVITIDAGSSGSRLHVHRVDSTTPGGLPHLTAKFSHKVKPGLSAYEDAPANASGTISDLLDLALENVPRSHWRSTPVFLKATAGLRTLPATTAEDILEVCREAIERTAFVFQPDWAVVISGQDEGKFGWMAANYLMGRFSSKAHLGPIGVIEMGGASLQVSFVPVHEPVDERFLVQVAVGDMEYTLYTHSFLGLGLEQAMESLTEDLQEASRDNPCVPTDALPMATGDFDQCSALMPDLLDLNKQCPVTSCSLAGVYQPSLRGVQFVAIENFFYTAEFFGVVEQFHKLVDAGRVFCRSDFGSLKERYKDASEADLLKYCFSAAYLYSTLRGLGLEDPFHQIEVMRDVDGIGIDWAIGSVLFEVIQMPPLDQWPPTQLLRGPRTDVSQSKRLTPGEEDSSAPTGWLLLGILAVITLALLVLRGERQRRRQQQHYTQYSG